MTKFELNLLKLAYSNYQKSGSSYAELLPANSDELAHYTTIAEYLSDEGYIVPLSDNICADSISVTSGGLLICYELTERGLRRVKENIKP